ncbi:MAG: hypothetical protein JO257_24385 [Deltaproteobacteria bacterium]|nr:hypothetical protein [Deltaproteobacteria bacterium]
MVWCDDDVLLAYADLVDACAALRVAWRKYSGRARLEHVSLLCDARMERAFVMQAADEARAAVRAAYVAIVALGQVVLGERELRGSPGASAFAARGPAASGAAVDDELEAVWRLVGVVLDVMAPYVSDADQVLRRVLLDGELLDDAITRLEEGSIAR